MTIHYPTGSRSENQQLPLADGATASNERAAAAAACCTLRRAQARKVCTQPTAHHPSRGFYTSPPAIRSTYRCPAAEGLLGIPQKTRQTWLFLIFRLSGKGKCYGQILQEVLKCLAHMKPPNVILLQQRLGSGACVTPPEEQKIFLLSLPSHTSIGQPHTGRHLAVTPSGSVLPKASNAALNKVSRNLLGYFWWKEVDVRCRVYLLASFSQNTNWWQIEDHIPIAFL